MGSGAVGELHAGRADRRPNGECLGRSCVAERRSKTPTMKRTGYRAPEIAHETAGVHQAARRRSGMAARGVRRGGAP